MTTPTSGPGGPDASDDRGVPDVPELPPDGPLGDEERRDRLADRAGLGRPGPAGEVESDVRPEVEVPEHQM